MADAIDGFTQVDRADIDRKDAYCSVIDIGYVEENGLDMEEIKGRQIEMARRTMDQHGVPVPRRLISLFERTDWKGRRVLVIQIADSESPPSKFGG